MTKVPEKSYRYSSCFKASIVEEVRSGLSINQVKRKYGIKGKNTIYRWLRAHGAEHLIQEIIYVKMKTEQDQLKALEAENKRLKIALAEAVLARDALESLVVVANDYYHTDLKKNLSGQPCSTVNKNKAKA